MRRCGKVQTCESENHLILTTDRESSAFGADHRSLTRVHPRRPRPRPSSQTAASQPARDGQPRTWADQGLSHVTAPRDIRRPARGEAFDNLPPTSIRQIPDAAAVGPSRSGMWRARHSGRRRGPAAGRTMSAARAISARAWRGCGRVAERATRRSARSWRRPAGRARATGPPALV